MGSGAHVFVKKTYGSTFLWIMLQWVLTSLVASSLFPFQAVSDKASLVEMCVEGAGTWPLKKDRNALNKPFMKTRKALKQPFKAIGNP